MKITQQDVVNVIKSRYRVNDALLASSINNKEIGKAKGAYFALCDFFGVVQTLAVRPVKLCNPSERMLKILKTQVIKNKYESIGVVSEGVWSDSKDKSVIRTKKGVCTILILDTCFGSDVLLMLDDEPLGLFETLHDGKRFVEQNF